MNNVRFSGTDTTCDIKLGLWKPGLEPDLLHARRILCYRVNPALEMVNLRRFSHFIEKVNEKNTGTSIQKRFSRDCS